MPRYCHVPARPLRLRRRYTPHGVRFAVVTPLPLAETVPLVAAAFAHFPSSEIAISEARGRTARARKAAPSTAPRKGAPAPSTAAAAPAGVVPSAAAASAAVPASQADAPPAAGLLWAQPADGEQPATVGALARDGLLAESLPFPDLGRAAGGAMAIERPGKRALLTLAWGVYAVEQAAEERLKPLDLVGHALTEPHAHSLATALRARALVPLAIELEPVVTAKPVARADGWQLWQLEITLAAQAESRWREAAALAVAAVEQLARRGVPEAAASEVATMASAAWRFSSRAPTALELASDLQVETNPQLSVAGPRTFAGTPEELSRAAQEAAKQLATRSPIITLWAADVTPLGVNAAGYSPKLPWPLDGVATLVPLLSPGQAWTAPQPGLPQQPLASGSGNTPILDWRPPPLNPWVPTSFEVPRTGPLSAIRGAQSGAPMALRSQRLGKSEANAVADGSGLGMLQLPGCVDRRTLARLRGSRAALADAECPRGLSPRTAERPLAVAAVQLSSPTSPHIYIYISPYLPTSPHISPHPRPSLTFLPPCSCDRLLVRLTISSPQLELRLAPATYSAVSSHLYAPYLTARGHTWRASP